MILNDDVPSSRYLEMLKFYAKFKQIWKNLKGNYNLTNLMGSQLKSCKLGNFTSFFFTTQFASKLKIWI